MSTRASRDNQKDLNEKHQAILSRLLKDEDNKYCVDCDAKGPRWAAWNLGVFLCIRCAGIHRNLGVHISKVKSVNLDSWTPEQIAMMEDMGNSRARAVYEANLPDSYKRPSGSDGAMEQFIRAKYEHKKYIAKEWIPPKPRSVPSHYYDDSTEKKVRKSKPKQVITVPGAAASISTQQSKPSAEPVKKVEEFAPMVDLSSPAKVAAAKPSTTSADLLADLFSSPQPVLAPSAAGSADLLGMNVTPGAPAPATQNGTATSEDLFQVADEKSQSAKDSIMALFGNNTSPAQAQAMPGSYGMQGHMGMYAMQGMPAQQPMMGGVYQQSPMMGQQPMATGYGYQGNMMSPQQQPMMPGQMMGYYNPQQQQQQMYNQQLQAQMANMSLGQAQQTAPKQGTVGGSSWTNGQTNNTGQTLNFDLWN